jgi:hypothetical protein
MTVHLSNQFGALATESVNLFFGSRQQAREKLDLDTTTTANPKGNDCSTAPQQQHLLPCRLIPCLPSGLLAPASKLPALGLTLSQGLLSLAVHHAAHAVRYELQNRHGRTRLESRRRRRSRFVERTLVVVQFAWPTTPSLREPIGHTGAYHSTAKNSHETNEPDWGKLKTVEA